MGDRKPFSNRRHASSSCLLPPPSPFPPLPTSKKKKTPRPAASPPAASLLAAALGALGEGVLLAEPHWRPGGLKIIFANDRLGAMTGFGPAALCGKSHGVLHVDQSHFGELRRWLRRLTPGLALAGEGDLVRADGRRLYVAWTFSAVPAAPGRSAHVAVHAQRLDAVGRLAGGVAHDFNNLLSVINGYGEILASKPAVRRHAARELGEVQRAGRHAADLVRQLLAFSRRQALHPRVVSLNRLVRTNADILAKLLLPGQTLTLDLAAEHDCAQVDPAQMQQVLLNLVLNARDVLPPGGEAVIRTHHRDISLRQNRRLTDLPPGRYVVLAVSDNGAGMDEAVRAHLFEPFFTTKEPGKGTGLGLALVYGVVQQSGGHIFVESAPAAGTTFEIFLPAVDGPAPDEDVLPATLPVTGGRETVLLVEADAVVRKMVAGILTADGYRVLDTGLPSEALRLARRVGNPVELLIAPVQASGDESEKLARTLHAAHPGLRVLAAANHEPPRLAWLAPAAQGGITKPFALSELLRAVRSLLDGKGIPAIPPHFHPPS